MRAFSAGESWFQSICLPSITTFPRGATGGSGGSGASGASGAAAGSGGSGGSGASGAIAGDGGVGGVGAVGASTSTYWVAQVAVSGRATAIAPMIIALPAGGARGWGWSAWI